MKTLLLSIAFFGLVALLSVSQGPSTQKQEFVAYFPIIPQSELAPVDALPAVTIRQEDRGGDFTIEFKNFAPAWRSQLVPYQRAQQIDYLVFKVSAEACRFLQTKPQVFNCNFEKKGGVVGTATVNGEPVHLQGLFSGLVSTNMMATEGRLEETQNYSIEGQVRWGQREFPFALFTPVKMVNVQTHTTVASTR
ncbi:MAG: hypothetical protein H6626_10505 [Pseudobdellovibrionaceae bacterium]|nr:hypothetical protein [Bdellovibrionales bacterium]USN46639.1 MAG: hypothetical protein H6626_10505 [Pseudobdellovibrionaceae bacterium]